MVNPGFIWVGNFGCLLPFLIIFNLFFGRFIFDSTFKWLGFEVLLILIFILRIKILARKINRQCKPKHNVIDVQGHVVEEDKKLR
ncbi:MAG: hypothetical protein PHR84_05650 [Candidatus Omnitrophica bacterium]|nr:hypothetical protein [Candidatus Omnitrophota bacterium]MDD5661138.1 hypothetical protein [Candidatus Omnitrophota bacterium]